MIKDLFYVEITDNRVDSDPPYVWQSIVFDTAEEALEFGNKIIFGDEI